MTDRNVPDAGSRPGAASALEAALRLDVARVAESLKSDPLNLAVLLTGPLAVGRVSEADKLYFAVIKGGEDGAIEHHFLDEGLGEVRRPIEMGVFPIAVARFLLKHGYADMVSYKSLEAFRCGRVLWEKDGVGTEMIEGAKRHIPEAAFIGEGLHGAVSALDDAVSLMTGGDYVNAVLVAREAAAKAVAMAVGGRAGGGDTGGASFLEAAARALPPEEFELFREIMGLTKVDAARAREDAARAREFAEYVLREIGVDPASVFGDEKGAQG